MVKFSPRTGLQPQIGGENLTNDSYLLNVCEKYSGLKIHHLGLVDYLLTENELSLANKFKHETLYFDPFNSETVLKQVLSILTQARENSKRLVFLVDLEVLKSQEFVGRSETNIDGFDQLTLVQIVQKLAECVDQVESLLLTNFNPTVEKENSGMFMATLVYKFVKKLVI